MALITNNKDTHENHETKSKPNRTKSNKYKISVAFKLNYYEYKLNNHLRKILAKYFI